MKERKKDVATTPKTFQETVEELRMVVQDHRVCWEVLPEQIPVKDEAPLKVGFDLMLYGTHAVGEHHTPGCEKCKQIYRDLRKIANWVIPEEERPSRYEISIYESAIGYNRIRDNRPDVKLTIRILHRSEYDRPVDDCEIACLIDMKTKLSLLGVQERHWKSS
ncbi:MAG: hypothetical protein NPIRA02_01950 [Nitrospirales bacterium]|nr:MAG: hypothetical protein NPIRA02_01950 [Nitrospirales bacterium]